MLQSEGQTEFQHESLYEFALYNYIQNNDPLEIDNGFLPQHTHLVPDDPKTSRYKEAWKVHIPLPEAKIEIDLPLKNVDTAQDPVRIAFFNGNDEDHMLFGALVLASMLMKAPDKKHIITISSTKSEKMIKLAASVVSHLRNEKVDVMVLQKSAENPEGEDKYSSFVSYQPVTSDKIIYLTLTREQQETLEKIDPEEVAVMDDVHSKGQSCLAMVKLLNHAFGRIDFQPPQMVVFKEDIYNSSTGKIDYDPKQNPQIHAAGLIPEYIGELPVVS